MRVSGISLETPGFLPYAHGYHHEFALNRPNRWLDNMLGLCFCDHCVGAAEKAGIAAKKLKAEVAQDVSAYLASDIDFPADMAEAFWLADARADGELAPLPRLALLRRDFAHRRDPRCRAQGCDSRRHPLGGAADGRRLV